MSLPDGSADREDVLRLILRLLIAADVAFMGINLVHVATPYLQPVLYSIEADGSFAEWFQYTKEFWIVILTAILWRRTGSAHFAGWLLLYTYVLCDDSFSIHEIGGDIAYRHLGFSPALGLRALDFGELLVNGLAALGFLVILAIGYARGTAAVRTVGRDLLMLFIILVGFGVALDTLHSVITSLPLRHAFALVEDGGEMITMSVTCWYVLTVVSRGGRAPEPSLFDRARRAVLRR